MRKCKFLTVVAAGVMAAAMALTGCGGNGNTSSTGSNSESGDTASSVNTMFPGTAEAGSITINLGSEPPSMNSVTTTDTVSFQLLHHVKDGLLMKDQNDIPQAGTAEKYEVSEDGLTWTFHIREDAVWEDGQPVTSHDFKFAWMKVMEPAVASEYSYMMYYVKGAEDYNVNGGSADDVGLECPDDKTFVVTLAAPCPYFDSLVAFPTFYPVREDEWGDDYATEANKMHYNGMFVMSEWTHNDKVVCTKNDKYYAADTCKLDKFVGLMLVDASAAINAFKAGQLDMVALSTGDQVKEMEASYPGVSFDSYSDGSSWCLMFNNQDAVLSNVNARKALTLCIDRASYINNIRKDTSAPAYHWTVPTLAVNGKQFGDVWSENKLITDADAEGAKAAWETACSELGIPTNTEIEYITDDGDSAKTLGEYIQGCAAKAGITLKIKAVPFKERLANQSAGTYQISMYGWGPDYNDPQTFLELWETGNANNKAFYSNADYDAQMKIIHESTDAEERMNAMIKAEEVLADTWAIGPFYYRQTTYVCSGKLNNMVRTVFQDWSLRFASING